MSPVNNPSIAATAPARDKTSGASTARSPADSPLRLQTKLAFAIVTAVGGMLLGTGVDTGPLAVIVVAFAAIGFIFVDWWKLFSLPALVAYGAMALTAVVCIVDFAQDSYVLAPKMVAVAQLLAIAQAILMLQEKTHRLFEQLLTFALLNCIVAAVFNDAFSYAVWFFPLTIVAGWALTLLAADETVARAETVGRDPADKWIRGFDTYDNQAAIGSFSQVARKLSWTSLILLLPAVTAIAAVIFFALPRRVEAQRGGAAEAMVGFSDTVRLGEIGRMQQSVDRALRVKLIDPDKNQPYAVNDGIYLRGLVLERYVTGHAAEHGGSSWQNRSGEIQGKLGALPPRFIPHRTSDLNFYDRVHVDIRCEPMRTAALFAIAPYHRIIGSEKVIQNTAEWAISRSSPGPTRNAVRFERIEYQFGTHGFRNGVQTPWIHDRSLAIDTKVDRGRPNFFSHGTRDDQAEEEGPPSAPQGLTAEQRRYLDELLDYPAAAIPAAGSRADEIVQAMPPRNRNPVEIAKRLEQDLAQSDRYTYTLDLDEPAIDGMDPLEQFLSVDRRGHCQYFASALAMMLRSQGIPARMVVGYHCNEFNNLGQYFVVRQSHAHAWVEALIEREDIPMSENVYGQPASQRYWVRLDPTPGGGGVPDADADPLRGGRRIAELARNLWSDYIIEMDPQRQDATFQSTPGMTSMSNSYRTWIERAKGLALRINSDDIEWPGKQRTIYTLATIVAVVLGGAAVVFLRRQFPDTFRRRRGSPPQPVARPSIAFYREALEMLERVGYARSAGQTPAELTAALPDERVREPASVLTRRFYCLRYGSVGSEPEPSNDNAIEQSLANLREGLNQSTRRPPSTSTHPDE